MRSSILQFLTSSSILTLTLTLTSCEKLEIAGGTPKCIQKEIKNNNNRLCDNASVSEYRFQNQSVYTFEPGSCGADMATPVYDASCNRLGSLGGIQGNTKINGEDFSNAEFVRTVWENKP